MLIIGLTGGIASGKSTVSQYLKERRITIIDADLLAWELSQPHCPAWKEIRDAFGGEVFFEDGRLNRKELAQLVFTSPKARQKLNNILHPKIIEAIKDLIAQYKYQNSEKLIVIDAPLLIETKMTDLVDEVWVVAIAENVQIERLMKRDGLSKEEAKKRLESQMPLREKLQFADRIIDNSTDVEITLQNVDKILEELGIDT